MMIDIITVIRHWKAIAMTALSGVVMILWGLLKYKSMKLDKAEHEIKVHDKAKEMRHEQDKQVQIIVEQEKVSITEELESNVKKSHSERIDSL